MAGSESYMRSASTPSRWARVKIASPPEAQKERPRRGPSLSVWPRRTRLHMTVVARGGAESWWQVDTRGRSWRVPGWVAIEDVMAWIMQERTEAPGRDRHTA